MAEHNFSEATFDRVLQLLHRIESIMRAEREDNWIHGIRALVTELEQATTDRSARQETLAEIRAAFRTMMCAKDGFGDYIIWRDDLQARIEANREFDALRTEVWHLLVNT